jgi:uncharacterized membrane protein YhfC
MVGVLVCLQNILISFQINSGNAGIMANLTPEAITSLTSVPSWSFIISGIDRILAVTLHIALTLIVLKGFQVNKKAAFLLLAIGIHWFIDFISIKASMLGGSLLQEGILIVLTALSILYIIRQARN